MLHLPSSYSSLTFVSGRKCSSFFSGTLLFDGPFLFTSLSVCYPSITAQMEVKLCMLLSQEKSIWQKGGAQKHRHRSGLPFVLNGARYVKCLVDKDQETGRHCVSVCHTACESIWLSFPLPMSNRGCRQKQRELSAALFLKDLVVISSAVCTSNSAVLFSSLRKYCVVVAG